MDGLEWKHPIKMDDLGVKPTIFGNIHIFQIFSKSPVEIAMEHLWHLKRPKKSMADLQGKTAC